MCAFKTWIHEASTHLQGDLPPRRFFANDVSATTQRRHFPGDGTLGGVLHKWK
jgi:hypothetical protein